MTEAAPEVMFIPLAVPAVEGFGVLDPGMLARRLPDFVHQVLNQGQFGPTGMLEVQSPPDEGPVTWVLMDAPPEADEAFELVPDSDDVRVVVTGELLPVQGGVQLEFIAYFHEDADERFQSRLSGTVPVEDPVPALLAMAKRLARALELPWHDPPKGLLTREGRAFFKFLEGLDNAMLLSGDLAIEAPVDREQLMRPFTEALALDPGFGLALRVAHSTMAMALEGERLEKAACQRFLDQCYSLQPCDADGCVAVAEHLSELGDDRRAIEWLQHATDLDPPPARGLENLGIMFANRGDTVRARSLWLRGIDVDGHPDFFAHLARLYFSEGREMDAWDMVLRGLRRVHERATRTGEWEEHERGAGVLLDYLHEHMAENRPLPDVAEALADLAGLLDPEDKSGLGLCLLRVGRPEEARTELRAALEDGGIDVEQRDRCVRALLGLETHDFERRLGRAADAALRGRDPGQGLADLAQFLELQPGFWPALFYTAVARRRLGEHDEAIDLLARALPMRPGQADMLHEMAILFDLRGNPKRALELVEEALRGAADDPKLLAAKVSFLLRLGREQAARECLGTALAADAGNRELRRLKRKLGP
jgi:tetratricopeptide (TPR) repeat protein